MYYFLTRMPYKIHTINASHQHMVAYLVCPKYKGEKLSSNEEELDVEWLTNIDGNYALPLMALQITNNDYYPKLMLLPNVTEILAPSN